MRLNGNTIRAFCINHIEKLGFTAAMALVTLFIYWGWSLEGYRRTPVELRGVASQANRKISLDTWEERLRQDDLDPRRKFSQEVRQNKIPIDHDGYNGGPTWFPGDPIEIVLRQDPALLPPIDLEVDALFGAVALRGSQPDPLAALPPSPRPGSSDIARGRPAADDFNEPDEEGAGDPGVDRKFPNPPDYWTRPAEGKLRSRAARSDVVPATRAVVAVKALVRFRAQHEEFERALNGAIGYQLTRDRPEFLAFRVSRAEVGDDPHAPLKYQLISGSRSAVFRAARWQGHGPDLTDPRFKFGEALTMDVPPLLMRDTTYFGLHSAIRRLDDPPPPPAAMKAKAAPPVTDGIELPTEPRRGRSETQAGRMFGEHEDAPDHASSPTEDLHEYKLLRFFDLTAKPGKKYRYRFQLAISDPNRPRFGPELNERMLEPQVIVRLAAVRQRKNEMNALRVARDLSRSRIYYRFTDWSEPSPVIETPPTRRLLAGPTNVDSRVHRARNRGGGYVRLADPVVRVCGVIWDHTLSTDVSYVVEATLGSVLNNSRLDLKLRERLAELKVVHPLTLDLKQLKDFHFRTRGVVVDMRAGDSVGPPRDKRNPQAAPAQVAAIDAYGNLVIRDEVDDVEPFRIYSFADDVPSRIDERKAGAPGDVGEGDADEEMGAEAEFGGRRRPAGRDR